MCVCVLRTEKAGIAIKRGDGDVGRQKSSFKRGYVWPNVGWCPYGSNKSKKPLGLRTNKTFRRRRQLWDERTVWRFRHYRPNYTHLQGSTANKRVSISRNPINGRLRPRDLIIYRDIVKRARCTVTLRKFTNCCTTVCAPGLENERQTRSNSAPTMHI